MTQPTPAIADTTERSDRTREALMSPDTGLGLEEMKPCPFCGGIARLGEWATWYVKCDECGVKTIGLSQAEAIAAWNRRALTEAPSPVEGWVLVPREPTEAMVGAAVDQTIEQYDLNRNWDDAKDVVEKLDQSAIYRAMVSAAPPAVMIEGSRASQSQPQPDHVSDDTATSTVAPSAEGGGA